MDLQKLFAQHPLLLIKFDASWCDPCKWAQPIIESTISHYRGSLALQRIDIDDDPESARKFHVLSVPTLILIRNGEEVWRMKGFDTMPVLIRALDPFVKDSGDHSK